MDLENHGHPNYSLPAKHKGWVISFKVFFERNCKFYRHHSVSFVCSARTSLQNISGCFTPKCSRNNQQLWLLFSARNIAKCDLTELLPASCCVLKQSAGMLFTGQKIKTTSWRIVNCASSHGVITLMRIYRSASHIFPYLTSSTTWLLQVLRTLRVVAKLWSQDSLKNE